MEKGHHSATDAPWAQDAVVQPMPHGEWVSGPLFARQTPVLLASITPANKTKWGNGGTTSQYPPK